MNSLLRRAAVTGGLLLSHSLSAQPVSPVDGVGGIKFATSPDQVRLVTGCDIKPGAAGIREGKGLTAYHCDSLTFEGRAAKARFYFKCL